MLGISVYTYIFVSFGLLYCLYRDGSGCLEQRIEGKSKIGG